MSLAIGISFAKIKAIIPALKPDELAKLRESIAVEGCRDPLVVWKGYGVLLDGHNRYAICQELGRPFSLVEREFMDKTQAMLWVINNQLARRNLTDIQVTLLIGREYNLEKKPKGAPRGNKNAKGDGNQTAHSERIDKSEKPSRGKSPELTAEQVAKKHRVGQATVRRSGDFSKAVEVLRDAIPEFAEKIDVGKIKIYRTDVLILSQALQQSTPDQRAQLLSELENDRFDLVEALEIAQKIVNPPKPDQNQSESRPTPEQREAARKYLEKQAAQADQPGIPKPMTDVVEWKSIATTMKYLSCPW